MPIAYHLPPEYQWRHEGTQQTLYLGDHDLIRVDPVRSGWIVQAIFKVPGVALQRFAVRSAESGRRHALRWTSERQRIIAHACGRDDLAPPIIEPMIQCSATAKPARSASAHA